MALDHYVSQVHLKRFYSPVLGNRMYAIRKSDLKSFTPQAKDVCRIEEGSSNSYLIHARAIEDFLRSVEPNYNAAVSALQAEKITVDCIYTIAGFAAFVSACSPTAMRLGTRPMQRIIESTGAIMEARGMFPAAPTKSGPKKFTELIRDGDIKIKVDPKYLQAMGVASVMERTALFGNFKWDILINELPDNEFFTCDYPAAMEASSNPLVFNRIVPLTPTLAVRIRPDIRIDRSAVDFSFKHFGWRKLTVSRAELKSLNQSIVRCAENEVYYRTERPWIRGFVEKNNRYQLQMHTTRISSAGRHFHLTTHKIARRSDG